MSEDIVEKLRTALPFLTKSIQEDIKRACGQYMNMTLIIWDGDTRRIRGDQMLLPYVHTTSVPVEHAADCLRKVAENFEQKREHRNTTGGDPKKAN